LNSLINTGGANTIILLLDLVGFFIAYKEYQFLNQE